MKQGDLILPILVISGLFLAVFGWVSWVLWKAFRKETRAVARVAIGLCLALMGTIALLAGVCGVWGLGSISGL